MKVHLSIVFVVHCIHTLQLFLERLSYSLQDFYLQNLRKDNLSSNMYTVMNFRVCNLSLIDVMEILLSRSKQYGNENKTNGQWMKKTILFFC